MNRKHKIKLVMAGIFISIFIYLNVIATKPTLPTIVDPYLMDVDTTEIRSELPSIQMYFFIKKYAAIYDIPEPYAFSVAFLETRYKGPCHTSYDPVKRSYAGALGPMQIMLATAKSVHGKEVTREQLISDIDLNVQISMKLLRKLHNKYKDWGKVFGCYNTGRPCVNQYAKMVLNKKYKWES